MSVAERIGQLETVFDKTEFRLLKNSLHYTKPEMAQHICEDLIYRSLEHSLHTLEKNDNTFQILIDNISRAIGILQYKKKESEKEPARVQEEKEEVLKIYDAWDTTLKEWYQILKPVDEQTETMNEMKLWHSLNSLVDLMNDA
jgi:hypothetical protein